VEGLAAPAIGGSRATGELSALAQGLTPGGQRGGMLVPVEGLDAASGRFRAALQPGGAGAPILGKDGGLAGLVTSDPSARFQVAGIVLAASHRAAVSDTLAAFLGAQGVQLGTARPGGIGAQSQSVLAIACGR
jgi:hypothetical protein